MKKPNTFANLTQSLIRYLNCPCQSFEPMEDDDPIQNAYRRPGTVARGRDFSLSWWW